MRWRKRDLRRTGIIVVGVLLLLAIMTLVPLSTVMAHEGVLGSSALVTVTVPPTPTVDATVTALNREKLQHENDWWWTYGAMILTSVISTLTLALAGLFAIVRYFNDRRDAREKQEQEAKRSVDDRKAERERRTEEQQRWLKDQETEREKRAEERFQSSVEGLASDREEAKIGAAITLRTFLRPGYEQFYRQVFDLAVAHLRLPMTSRSKKDSTQAAQLTTLNQALVVVFKEALPLVRNIVIGDRTDREGAGALQSLDATNIQLGNAFLWRADLKQAWMPQAFLRKANLAGTILIRTDLLNADLSDAILSSADLSGAYLLNANLKGADLSNADLSGAYLNEANLNGSNLSGTNFEKVQSLEGTDLRGVTGLTKEQLEACKAKGAIIDEATMASPSQPTASSAAPIQSSDTQAPSVTPA